MGREANTLSMDIINNALTPFILVAGVIVLTFVIVIFVREQRIGPLVAFSLMGFFVLIGFPTILKRISETLSTSGDSKDESSKPSPSSKTTPSSEASPSPSPSETSSPAPQAPESTTNWGEVWMIVAIVAVGIIVLVVAVWLAVTLVRRSKVKHQEYVEAREKTKAEKKRQEALRKQVAKAWEEATSKHDKLDAEYLSYQKDLSLIAQYPLMTDLAVPLTKKAVRAMTEARNQRPSLAPSEMDSVDGYRAAVTSFELALRAAVSNAKREGLKNFSEHEQKDLRQVQDLLRMAEDKAGSPHERRSAYERAIKTLQEILGEVPEDALLEIEAQAKEDGILLAIMA